MTITQILAHYKNGYMTASEAVDELLKADPVRFQRQRHNAASFLWLN